MGSDGEASWAALAAEWADLRFAASQGRETRENVGRKVRDRAVASARRDPAAFWDWFLTLTLDDRANGSLVANVPRNWWGPVPERAFAALVRAAIEEPCPSFNRRYVEPLARTYGADAASSALLDWLERSTPDEKAGAANALYWTRVCPQAPEDCELLAAKIDAHTATAAPTGAKQLREQAAARRKIAEQMREDGAPEKRGAPRSEAVVARERLVRLREFVATENVVARRSILAGLCLDAAKYPAEMRSFVSRAIAIARESDDEYLRHRVEIQLGRGGPFMALPDRPRD